MSQSNTEIFNCEQGTPDWFNVRKGIPTASEFATVMANGKGGAPSKTRRTYMLKLLGERLTGEPMESFTNEHMERGKKMEEEARLAYSLASDCDLSKIGFVRRNDVIAGASPDSLVDANGLLEIKTKLPHLQLAVLEDDEVPTDHIAQIQGQLWITGREWVDFVSYWPKLPMFTKRVYRDESYISRLMAEVSRFNAELEELQSKYQRVAA